ncbi:MULTISPECIES: autorepressor SdpR family transcription factor [Streptococcus]|uniref:Winged helix-turn-helix transcriptional regulator n=1 Tax=Streptococcus zalophi TaxID=640031 RepID=A0A934P9C9_9STRE|nr:MULTISPECIES: autorepressor SdpR family transcription factor [Streptococcus]MBJ8349556.1 winged helix-turn-helix transcriptional regulator [Streptococcus zalophi]MCU9533355.1 autorepressor SdpR family transcription factor [Streptococcus sp. CSL10205-OR2]
MGIDQTLKALNDEKRREILTLLKKGRMSATDIHQHFDVSDATISHHLSVLLKADLIFLEKEKNYRYYSLNASVFEDVLRFIMFFKK